MQVFVIVGGVTRVIPLTGVTLPFVAYGGSSVVMNFVLLALLLVVSDRARAPVRSAAGAPELHAAPSRAGDVRAPSKNVAQMGTSTIARVKPRLLMRLPIARPHNRYRGIAAAEPGAQRICSPAGLHRRPWLARLRRALAEDLFVLHYQPIVSLGRRPRRPPRGAPAPRRRARRRA